ncbi:MAG TPA: peptidoglycan DD-metalloendopeptidase family protein [Kofleriaceae bacterium]|nr:peptidoglycan DD-metalloendopeptidase family protein [Kofleriaceae bacterium]
MRVEWAALGLALALSPEVWAGGTNRDSEEPHAEPVAPQHRDTDAGAPDSAAAGAPVATPGPMIALARQLDDETAVTDRALEAIADKLAAVQLTRIKRLGAALRLVRAGPGDDAMGLARRRAAARLLVARDAGERALLVEEAAQLRASRDRIAGEIAQLPSIALPGTSPGGTSPGGTSPGGTSPGPLAPPALGPIVRHFGTLTHERSKAMLSRRGIDIEVDGRSPVTAPAAGTVRYAGPIRGLDQGVILDHGAYVTVVAKLGEVALPVGAPIAAGDRIGRAARHRVYFEVRVKLGPGGLPIDPEPLLGKRRRAPALAGP